MSHIVLEIYFKNRVGPDNLLRNSVHTKYVQEKGYRNLLVSQYLLFLKLFLHNRELYCSNQVGVEPVFTFRVYILKVHYVITVSESIVIKLDNSKYHTSDVTMDAE